MGGLYPVAALVLLCTLIKGDLPEDDFRIISMKELLSYDSDVFSDNVTRSFGQLLFDVARDQVIVGARDTLLRLSLRGLRPLERADWPASLGNTTLCQNKGQTEADCHNYVKVLLSYGHKLLACGTNAFNPICSWREVESVGTVRQQVPGVAQCPHSPRANMTALLAATGEYYAGTPTDFTSSDRAIYRSRGASAQPTGMLRTNQYDNWLTEPQFVGSFEDQLFVYFVFREVAVETMNCGKTVYSRIARVCKNDSGGHLMMKDNWSTFLKARLACAVPGDVPFHYDEVQAMEYIAEEGLLIAAFTTPDNGVAGSAICVYSMSEVVRAFSGPYWVQESPAAAWEPRAPSPPATAHFACEGDQRPLQSLEYHRYHLMQRAVAPRGGAPAFTLAGARISHVAAERGGRALFVATRAGDVLKLLLGAAACLLERWRLGADLPVLNMQFVKETMSVYIGSESSIVRIAGSHCGLHATEGACRAAHCRWRGAGGAGGARCLPAEGAPEHCHVPVDGGWSEWSAWAPCAQVTGAPSLAAPSLAGPSLAPTDDPDMCQCRVRSCTNPRPRSGGRDCVGTAVSVANCTVHGAWGAWGAWGACGASCGIALKSRRRACAAPAPRHGGRACVGADREDIYCSNLPPCADPSSAPVDGGWSEWSAWSACVGAGAGAGAGCAGARERRRACNNPAPRAGGAPCEGAAVERQPCEIRPCEVRKATAWTRWLYIPGNTSDGSYSEKRFKFLCKASSPEQLRLTVSREEERFCTARGVCSSSPPVEEGWAAWGPWGPCSASCEGGQQARARACLAPPCAGAAAVLRTCNSEPCKGVWSCWSEWSACEGGCGAARGEGAGRRRRTRVCLSAAGCDAGAAAQTAPCVSTCDEPGSGWGEWGAWGACVGGAATRRRACADGRCVGAQAQTAPCEQDNELYAMPAYSQDVEMASFVNLPRDCLGWGGILGIALAAFIIGCAGGAGAAWGARRLPWRRGPRVPSSPHYITARQNSYVTVPLKDVPRKAKRQPSFSGIGGSSVLLSKSNNISSPNNQTHATPKLYPKSIANEYDSMGTLRRHSNQPKNNFDFEEDKFY